MWLRPIRRRLRKELCPTRALDGDDGVVEPVVPQPFVRVDARIGEGCVLVPPEGEHRLVHVAGVEYAKGDEQVEVRNREAGDGLEEVGLQLGDLVLERVFTETGEIRESWDASRELDQLLLNLLSLALVFLLLVREFFLQLGRQAIASGAAELLWPPSSSRSGGLPTMTSNCMSSPNICLMHALMSVAWMKA